MSEPKSKLNRFRGGLRGTLMKQGRVFKKWRPRYFILDKRRLKCYADDSLKELQSELIIDEALQIYDVGEEVEGMKYLFYFVGKNPAGTDEVMLLAASTEKEKQDWIEAITDGVHDGFKQVFQPDLWSSAFYPTVDMFVSFADGSVCENGNILRPAQTISPPEIVLRGVSPDEKFSFVMVDIDPIPSPENANSRFYLHWGVINFSGSDLKTGDELAPWVPASPEYNSGLHRYFFLLFKQRSQISPIVLSDIVELFLNRDGFAFMKWVRRMAFGNPAAINGFYTGWEEICDELHEQLNWMPSEEYRSPNQVSKSVKEQEELRIETAKIALFKELSLRDIFYGEEDRVYQQGVKSISLSVSYDGSGSGLGQALDGMILTPSATNRAPEVKFTPTPNAADLFTLILTDPDAPSRIKPDAREFVHWVMSNISGGDLSTGVDILSYAGPAPPYSSGLHRYVFTLYKQKAALSEEDVTAAKAHFENRIGIKTFNWVRSLPEKFVVVPVGLEAFLSEWETAVDEYHAAMGWMPPENLRSPKQMLVAMQIEATTSPDKEAGEELLRLQSEKRDQEQFLKLKAAEEVYRSTAGDIDISALAAAVAAYKLEEAASNPSTTTVEQKERVATTTSTTTDASSTLAPAPKTSANSKNDSIKQLHKLPNTFHATAKDKIPVEEVIVQEMVQATAPIDERVVRTTAKQEIRGETVTDSTTTENVREERSSTMEASSTLDAEGLAQIPSTEDQQRSKNSELQKTLEEQQRLIEQQQVQQQILLQQQQQQLMLQQQQQFLQQQQLIQEQQDMLLKGSHSRSFHNSSFINAQAAAPVPASELAPAPSLSATSATMDRSVRVDADNTSVASGTGSVGTTNVAAAAGGSSTSAPARKASGSSSTASAVDLQKQIFMKQEMQEVISSRDEDNEVGAPPTQRFGSRDSEDSRRSVDTTSSPSSTGRKVALQRNPSVANMKKPAPSSPGLGAKKSMFSSGADDLDSMLRVGNSTVNVDDDDLATVRSDRTRGNGVRSASPPRGASPSRGGRAISPPRSASAADTSVAVAAPPVATLQRKVSLFRPQSQIIQMSSQFDAGVAGSPSGDDASAAAPKKSLRPSTSMYYKPIESKPIEPPTIDKAQEMTARLSSATATTEDKCALFGITSTSVLDGEVVKKKYTKDFMFKDTFVWIDPVCKSLHWGKNAADKANTSNTKFINLDRVHSYGDPGVVRPQGEFKGLFKTLEQNGTTLNVICENGDVLTMKVSDGNPPAAKRAADWAKMIKSFS